jgi:hypothetical protein
LLGATGDRVLAIALNGRIEAVTEARGASTFTVLLPPQAIRAGPNTLRVYVVDGRELKALQLTS